MNRQELTTLVSEVAGTVVADALARQEQRAAATRAAHPEIAERIIQPRVDVDGRDGLARIDRANADSRKGMLIGYWAIALRNADMRPLAAMEWGAKNFKEPEIKAQFEKALVAGELANGGAFINPEHSQDFIDLLTPATIVRRYVRNTVDVSKGSLDMPRLTSDATVTWGGEIEEIRESSPTTDQLVMRAFQEKALVPFSNTWLQRGGPRVAAIVRNSTMRAMSIGEDYVFLMSPGTEHRPKGLRYWAPAANRIAATAWTGTEAQKLTAASADLGRLVLAMEENNIPMTHPFWAMSPRTKMYLMTVRDSLGNYVYRAELEKNLLWGMPVEKTTQIQNNLGAGADESLIFLTDADEFMLGQGETLQVAMSDQGTIVDADGNVISLFQRNMSALRLINEVDLKPQHSTATAHLTGVKWAPAA